MLREGQQKIVFVINCMSKVTELLKNQPKRLGRLAILKKNDQFSFLFISGGFLYNAFGPQTDSLKKNIIIGKVTSSSLRRIFDKVDLTTLRVFSCLFKG